MAGDERLITMPEGTGQILLQRGGLRLCRLMKTMDFVKFCKDRDIRVSAERLLTFERLRLFSPLFRLRTPDKGSCPWTWCS